MRYLLKITYVAFFCRNRINGKSIHGIKEGLKEGDWAITSSTLGSTRGGGEGTEWPPFGPDRPSRRRVEGCPTGEPKARGRNMDAVTSRTQSALAMQGVSSR